MAKDSPKPTAPPLPDFIADELPYDRKVVKLSGGEASGRRVHLIDHGPEDAPTVLLLHGNPTWSFLWRKVIAGLEGLRCVAPDLLGLGLSDKPHRLDLHSVALHAGAIATLARDLDLNRIILVGQDWGGPFAVAAGTRVAARISGLVLANTAIVLPKRPRGTLFHRFARLPLISDLVFRGFSVPQRMLHKVQGDPTSIQGDVARAYRWPLRRWRDRIAPLALARMVPNGPDHPSMEEMRAGEAWALRFSGPVALVWGERDPILGRALARHEQNFPQALVWRTQAGHFLQEEAPETLVEAIRYVADQV